jgi:hypothetical protein
VLLRLDCLCQNPDLSNEEKRAILERIINLYARHFFSKPQLEFFLNGITNSDPCAIHIATYGCEVYRSMAEQLFFKTDAPSVRKLKKMLETKAG